MKTPTLFNEDGSETELPFKWEICSRCEGNNVSTAHVEHEGGGITAAEIDELGEEFREAYFRGDYDRPCPHCEGGKVKVVQWGRLSPAQKKAWNAQVREDREYDAIVRMEQKMGA